LGLTLILMSIKSEVKVFTTSKIWKKFD